MQNIETNSNVKTKSNLNPNWEQGDETDIVQEAVFDYERHEHPAQSFLTDQYPYQMRTEAESFRQHPSRVFPPHIYGFILGGSHLAVSIIVTAFALTFLNSQVGPNAQFIPKSLVWMGMIILPFAVSIGMFLIATLVFFQIQKRFDWMLKVDGRAHRKELKRAKKSFGLKKATLRRSLSNSTFGV